MNANKKLMLVVQNILLKRGLTKDQDCFISMDAKGHLEIQTFKKY